jgi:hypothetical protein
VVILRAVALLDRVGAAAADLHRADAAMRAYFAARPGQFNLPPEDRHLSQAVEAAKAGVRAAQHAAHADFLAAHQTADPVRWEADTSRAARLSGNPEAFAAALDFAGRVVSAGTGVDPAVACRDDRGPTYHSVRTPAGAVRGAGYVTAPPRTEPVAFAHELGHHVEDTAPGAREVVQAFLAHRTAGEEPADLFAMGLTQAEGATGVKDHFDRVFPGKRAYYAGRRYPDGGTEVLSLGLEALYDDPAGFARKDPEWFALTVGILSGDLLQPGGGRGH